MDSAAKMRENHLRTINKSLKEEIRKINKVKEEIINIEYLRNVIIKFLEKRNTRVSLFLFIFYALYTDNNNY